MAPFTPSYADICVARAMLKSFGLPTELVLSILEFADYESRLEFTSKDRVRVTAIMGAASAARVSLAAGILSTRTLRRISSPRVTLKVKEIAFEFKSKDQGWTSQGTDGTYKTSSWLEASIFRPGPRLSASASATFFSREYEDPMDLQLLLRPRGHRFIGQRPENVTWYLQGNKVAERNAINYRVLWAPDHFEGNEGAGRGEGFIDALQQGDSVLVWARAMYPGWQCAVDSMKMSVRYGFDEHF